MRGDKNQNYILFYKFFNLNEVYKRDSCEEKKYKIEKEKVICTAKEKLNKENGL